MPRWLNRLGSVLFRFCLLLMAVWAMLALLYSDLPGVEKAACVAIFGVMSLFAFVGKYSDYRTRLGFIVLFSIVFGWWLLLRPSNHRNWQRDVAILPSAEVNGRIITIHNIRNCDYRTETDYTTHYYDKTFDVTNIQSLDLFLIYWGSPYIAHSILSFNFNEENPISISIETRKEVGEEYSTVKGFFRQYESIYVVADERDLIGLRTNYRGEQVYLYRLNATPDFIQKVFLDFVATINSLNVSPAWYNALTGNCTTGIRSHIVRYNEDSFFDWRVVVNGFADEMLYERKRIDTSMPFPELKKISLINERAKGIDKSPDFSRMIRVGLPNMKQDTTIQ
ncbi:MAG: DUF4105 domain-containing protein [bacterium]|nr:DUF4105 domain-containing protein [bacterium]